MSKYDDIIGLEHHVSKTRTPMPLINRAAQFAPFAALSGHEEAIEETARLTAPKKILSYDELKKLSRQITFAIEHLAERRTVSFTYFTPDDVKDGGRYSTITGVIKKLDEYTRLLYLEDGAVLNLDNIMSMKVE